MSPRARRTLLIVVLLLLLALLTLLLSRCSPPKPVAAAPVVVPKTSAQTSEPVIPAPQAAERLTPAVVNVPERVEAGAVFEAGWTGPDNPGDYLTIVRPDAAAAVFENYQETRRGATLALTAPMQAGEWEVRYVTVRSKTVLARAPLVVTPVSAALIAPETVTLGAALSVEWKGPNNVGDFLNIVPAGAPDEAAGNYADAAQGSPAKLTAPVQPGAAEIRYVSGQGRLVLARRPIVITAPDTTIEAANEVVAGSKFSVTWQGPKNRGDYLTIVSRGTPDGQYRNYTDTAQGSPLELTAPIEAGPAEIRYMTGTGARVLARRPISVVAAKVEIEASGEAVAGAPVTIVWSGPKNTGDYLTIVAQSLPDGQYGNYAEASKGSPLNVTAPIKPGAAEIRYMSGQGAKVLARRALTIVPARIELVAPAQAKSGEPIAVEWKGPNNPSDYLTVVAKSAKDGASGGTFPTSRGSPAKLAAPKEPGVYEVRYMSGQGNLVLARREIEVR
jgi:hypothetical protein